MDELPETRYADSAGLGIAYQVLGSGPIDLVLVPQIVSHVEFAHELPGYTDYLRGLARFARVITFDKRGTGLSDRTATVALLEERIDDLLAVMDAAGSERAAVFGLSEGGTLAVGLAAQHPHRVSHLVLCGAAAWYVGDTDEGAFLDPDVEPMLVAMVIDQWGGGALSRLLAPSLEENPGNAPLYGKLERHSAGPSGMRQLWEWTSRADVRPLLSSIKAPTLVMRRAEEIASRRSSQYLVEHIDGARFLEVPGVDHLPWVGDWRAVVNVVEEFVTGTRSERVAVEDSILATVLFTDIVGSTEQLARLGDRRWRELLDAHDEAAAREVARFRGRVVNSTGDGLLAAFDGPARAIRCARAIATATAHLGVQVRSGLHTGECEQRGDDLAGIAVHIGSRVADLATAGEVLVTSTVRDLVFGAEFDFLDRGDHHLKGVPGSWSILALA